MHIWTTFVNATNSHPRGVEACIRSSYSLAATDGWDSLIAREVDAMCHCLCFGHRRTFSMDDGTGLNHGEGWDWRDKDLRSNASMCLLDMKKSKRLGLHEGSRTSLADCSGLL
eukprot:321854-Amphidinium_carterae.1